jgi:23S rRNA (guanosine2251-2'-O)-methyltransferase
VARRTGKQRADWFKREEPAKAKPAKAKAAPRRRSGAAPAASAAPQGRTSAPRGLGGDQVEGRRAVRELLAARRRGVKDLWLAEGTDDSPLLAEIVDLATEQRVPIRRVGRSRLDAAARTDAPQGVLAHAEPLPEATLEELAGGEGDAFLLCLDGITDPHNLGALLRTAECAGVTGVVLPKHRAAHVTPTVAKAAAGAIEHLSLALVPGIPAALRSLRGGGVWTVGLDAEAPRTVYDLGRDLAAAPVALVLGAEGTGLSRLARERCDLLVAIPQRGAIDSLNVAAAGAVACFEVARRRSS